MEIKIPETAYWLHNFKQALVENIGGTFDFIDKEVLEKISEELHIEMAEAAFGVFVSKAMPELLPKINSMQKIGTLEVGGVHSTAPFSHQGEEIAPKSLRDWIAKKVQKIGTLEQAEHFCEGLVNDLEHGLIDKVTAMNQLGEYTNQILNFKK